MSKSDDQVVRMAQTWMKELGHYKGPIDGDWGPLSDYAWKLSVNNTWPDTVSPVDAAARDAGGLRRIILHWTAGAYSVGDAVNHYHGIIDRYGFLVPGKLRPEDNIDTTDGIYTPHALNANTGAIGLAVAAMHNAQGWPAFKWGNYPLLPIQIDGLVREAAKYARTYGIPVTRRTILTHAEVEPTLGIKQNGKWDIRVLPGMTRVQDPIIIGDMLRERISALM